MNPEYIQNLLEKLYNHKITPQKALDHLKTLPFEDLGFAHLDHHRQLRTGMPEVIYCEGKAPDQILQIIKKLHQGGSDMLATRLDPELYKKIKSKLPKKTVYNSQGRTLVLQKKTSSKKLGNITLVTAGTSDIPVAEEAVVTAEYLGSRVDKIFDVGVAGIHRLLDKIDRLRAARVLIVVAGMDGALVSVVGGLVDKPVIAVPTSVGYGASFNGLSALLTMLNSCAAGVGTVNIDNGFGAGCLAHRINILGEPPEI